MCQVAPRVVEAEELTKYEAFRGLVRAHVILAWDAMSDELACLRGADVYRDIMQGRAAEYSPNRIVVVRVLGRAEREYLGLIEALTRK